MDEGREDPKGAPGGWPRVGPTGDGRHDGGGDGHAGRIVGPAGEPAARVQALERELAELADRTAELDRSNARLGAVLRCIGSALLVVDRAGRVAAGSARAAAVLGVHEGEVGRPLRALAVRPPLSDVLVDVEAVLAGGPAVVRDVEAGAASFRVSVDPLLDLVDRPDGAILVVDDVTEERARARDFVALAENAPDIVARYDRDLRHVYVNRALERFTGRPREEWIGKRNGELGLDPALVEAVEDALRRTFATGSRQHVEFAFEADRRYAFEARLEPEKDEAGAVVSVVLISRDVTENRALAAQRAELEARFHQARKMQSLGTLSGGIAHEFNNLLMAIVGFTELLLGDPRVTTDMREDLEEIARATRRGRDLVRQILAFTRPAAGTAGRVHPAVPLARLARLFERTLPRHVRVRVDVADGVPAVRGDAGHLEQIVTHLVQNAVDAMDGGGTVEVRVDGVALDEESAARVERPPGDYVRIAVQDEGRGMDDATRARAFEPFFTTKPVGSGTGMGLSIVYGLVSSVGGAVTCESAVGVGTTFEVFLPVATRASSASPEPTERAPRTHVLVVDDEQAIRRLYARALGDAGYDVLLAPDGAAGLALLERHRDAVALVVLDLGLPGLSGLETLARLRASDATLPVLVATGYADDEVAAARRAGATAILGKPFTKDDLVDTVRALAPPAAAPPATTPGAGEPA